MAAPVAANRLELLQIADAVARDKSIDKQVVLTAMEEAMLRAANNSIMLAKKGDSMPAPAPWARMSRSCAPAGPVSSENVRRGPFVCSCRTSYRGNPSN